MDAAALVGKEEKRLVSFDGATQRASELILLEGRPGDLEEVASVHVLVADKLIKISARGVAA